MKLVMTLLVRDEEDIVRQNIEYHLSQGVDFIVATDNLSVDRTTDILRDYERQGVLRYIHEPSDDYNQHAWVTRMARLAYTDHGADWVINNDADEFWWPLRERTLKAALAEVPESCDVVAAERFNFVPVEDEQPGFISRMIFRERTSLNARGAPLPNKVAHRGSANVRVVQGNHSVLGLGDADATLEVMEILHFPIRSHAQLENKAVKGGAAYERNRELPECVGSTWRELFRRYQREGSLQEYVAEQVYGAERIRQGLAAGTLLEDERLRHYFAQVLGEVS